ncbi:MAG: baseplate J/gp47 family protein [Candidatus Accumulibacter sp.]|jgi:phage-related baseplate assembly protein|nr:baseplate J/gp47 family protein [Accumulibacter sp.]
MTTANSLPEPDFIGRDPQAITAEIVAWYEERTGRTLYPAQVDRVMIDMIAYRETLLRIGVQEAAKQNLLAFARAPMLDYLGELVGVVRLGAASARTILRFAVEAPRSLDLAIPAGTRVDVDDALGFTTDEAATLPAGESAVETPAACDTTGAAGNGWLPGQIARLADDLGEDVSAQNTVTSAGGADEEDDERLRERIRLAPESFSVAGSRQAYLFHALSAHQDIVDVAVISHVPGEVTLYPLTAKGLPGEAIKAAVLAATSGEKVRPLCDSVFVADPVAVDYAIEALITLYADADAASALKAAQAAAASYAQERAAGLGRDLVPSQIVAALSVPGVYRVELESPALTVLDDSAWAHCTGIALSLTGVAHG